MWFNALGSCLQMCGHRAHQIHGGAIPRLLTAGQPSGFQLSTAVNLIMVSGRDLCIYINHSVIFQENSCLGAWIVECGFRMFPMTRAQPKASLYECLPTCRQTGVGEKECAWGTAAKDKKEDGSHPGACQSPQPLLC